MVRYGHAPSFRTKLTPTKGGSDAQQRRLFSSNFKGRSQQCDMQKKPLGGTFQDRSEQPLTLTDQSQAPLPLYGGFQVQVGAPCFARWHTSTIWVWWLDLVTDRSLVQCSPSLSFPARQSFTSESPQQQQRHPRSRTHGYFLAVFWLHILSQRQVAAVNPAVSNNTPAELVGSPVRLSWLQGTTGAVAWAPNNLVLILFAVCLL